MLPSSSGPSAVRRQGAKVGQRSLDARHALAQVAQVATYLGYVGAHLGTRGS